MTYGLEFWNTTAGRVLRAIRQRGKASIKEVAADLGVTTSAVRLHLIQLQARGAIRADKVHDGVGRPHYTYSVTPEAHTWFSPDYGDLAKLLFQEIARTREPDELSASMRRLAAGLAARYRPQMSRHHALEDRVSAWSELLVQRGVTVQVEKTAEGYVLHEIGCLYHSVAPDNRAVCEMERQVMAELLQAGVRLDRCAVDGYDGCRFTVLGDRSLAPVIEEKE